jgi:hypothetical protein
VGLIGELTLVNHPKMSPAQAIPESDSEGKARSRRCEMERREHHAYIGKGSTNA